MKDISLRFLTTDYYGKEENLTSDVNANAAGIDIGSRMHIVAVDQSTENVRTFKGYKKDHQEIASSLHCHHLTTVAM